MGRAYAAAATVPAKGSPRARPSSVESESLVGMAFGLLTVTDEAEPYTWRGRITHRCWECICSCGSETVVRHDALTSGHTRSCGCEKVRVAIESHTRHGGRAAGKRSYEYDLWQRLREGGPEGRRLPRRWQGAGGFSAFLEAVGKRPGPRHRLVCEHGRSGARPVDWRWVEDAPRAGVPRWILFYRGTAMTFRELATATGTSYATLLKRFERGQPILQTGRRALQGPFAVG